MTPPMYSPWLRAFEALGRIGFASRAGPGGFHSIGSVDDNADCMQDQAWRSFLDGRKLFDAWSAPPASAWSAYARPTLFAALDAHLSFMGSKTPDIRPVAVPGLAAGQAPRQPFAGLGRDTAVILDLPARESVAYAALLAFRFGYQPVVLFNNWPHPDGLVHMEGALAALLHFSPWAAAKDGAVDRDNEPPVFVLDRRRMPDVHPRPLDFDNRYYHLEADLPSPATLRQNGINRVLYVCPAPGETAPLEPAATPAPVSSHPPVPLTFTSLLQQGWHNNPPIDGANPDADDLNGYLHECGKSLGVSFAAAQLDKWEWAAPIEHVPPVRKTAFTTVRDPAFRGFRRNAAGGFGSLVPEPGSGG